MKIYIYTLSLYLFLTLIGNNAFAQTASKNNDNAIYTSTLVDLEISTCTETINKTAIIEKEFADTKFSLDVQKNQIIIDRKNQSDSKIIEYVLSNNKLIFKDQEEYGKLEAYVTMVNNLPVLKFKDHSDDCFFFVINFSK